MTNHERSFVICLLVGVSILLALSSYLYLKVIP
jgi:hypothetical protein